MTAKLGSGTPFRKFFGWMNLLAVILVFATSGWVAGIVSIPIGVVLAALMARILMPPAD